VSFRGAFINRNSSVLNESERYAQDGDRAVVDYRRRFERTKWADDPRNDVSEERLNYYINNSVELVSLPGGFERFH